MIWELEFKVQDLRISSYVGREIVSIEEWIEPSEYS